MGDARLEIVRALDSFEARPLEGTDFGWLPFFSPDGESIGFYTNNHIAAISLAGGMTRKIVSAADGSGEAEQL